MAFFCEKTGVRIAAPGVCKACDPINGHDEVVEVDGIERAVIHRAEKFAEKPAEQPKTNDAAKPADKGK